MEELNRGVVPLRLGDAVHTVEVPGSRSDLQAALASSGGDIPATEASGYTGASDAAREPDLSLIARRARMKAESCRVYIERRAVDGDPTRERAVIRRLDDLLARGKALEGCFLWVFWKHEEQPSDARLGVIANCYDALAGAADLCAAAVAPESVLTRAELERAFQHFAEASSALRVALGWTWLTSPDRDQDESHFWLRRQTFDRQVFVPRYMTLQDTADPERAEAHLAEIGELAAAVEARRDRSRSVEALLNRARYHARRAADTAPPDVHDLRKINEALEAIEAIGVPGSDVRLRELRRLLDGVTFPPGLEPHAYLIEAWREPSTAGELASARRMTRWSDQVVLVRERLAGGRAVIIGGERRLRHIDRMIDAFQLEDVDWVPLSEHGTGSPMRAPIARPSTRVVLVLVKLCGHLHAEEARQYARTAGKDCVMLPAGYNPEQIAEQYLRQLGTPAGRDDKTVRSA